MWKSFQPENMTAQPTQPAIWKTIYSIYYMTQVQSWQDMLNLQEKTEVIDKKIYLDQEGNIKLNLVTKATASHN